MKILKKHRYITEDKFTEFFCFADVFCNFFNRQMQKWIKRKSARAVFNHYFALIILDSQ